MWGHNTAIFTKLYLLFLTLWFNKVFKLIFTKSSSWPETMYAEHWRKLAWATFLDNFPYFQYNKSLEHLWTVAYLNMLLCFQSKLSFNWLLVFYFHLVLPFYVLNCFFSTITPVLSEPHHYFNYLLVQEVYSNILIKRFPPMNLIHNLNVRGFWNPK